MNTFSEYATIGVQLDKIEFWAQQYEFSFQFWGENQNNVYISRDSVEIASFGGESCIKDILDIAIKWCEKANPRKKYPFLNYSK